MFLLGRCIISAQPEKNLGLIKLNERNINEKKSG